MSKKIYFIIFCITLFLFFLFVFRKSFYRLLKQSTNLNYQDEISYIVISDKGRLGKAVDGRFTIQINDPVKILRIMNYINSLELIEEEIENPNENPDLNSVGYFTIDIVKVGFEKDDNAHDLLTFKTNMLDFAPGGLDWGGTRYYIKDCEYNPLTKYSKVYEFLNSMINKEISKEN